MLHARECSGGDSNSKFQRSLRRYEKGSRAGAGAAHGQRLGDYVRECGERLLRRRTLCTARAFFRRRYHLCCISAAKPYRIPVVHKLAFQKTANTSLGTIHSFLHTCIVTKEWPSAKCNAKCNATTNADDQRQRPTATTSGADQRQRPTATTNGDDQRRRPAATTSGNDQRQRIIAFELLAFFFLKGKFLRWGSR